MSALVPFDTLKFVETLEAGGFTHGQAKAAAQAFAEATGQELATKTDLAAVRAELKADIAATQADIASTKAELKAELRESELRLEAKIESLKGEMINRIESTKADMIKCMFGTIGFETLIIVGAVVARARAAHP
jgi:molecular chaperone GrpE (heat shock protein)